MIKTLRQNGLNFIASKYKELKSLLNTKADKSEIKTKLSELIEDSTHRTVTDTEKSTWNNKVSQVSGKGLSANDYDNTAKAKVDAIPTNPKYTDTITSVVDNLITDDATKALSAKQGVVLQYTKADKSDISGCKTKGYDTPSTWQALSTERDLGDWIGDFDKRTRELKSGGKPDVFNRTTGGGTGFIKFIKNGNMVTVHVSMTASNKTNQSVQQEFYVDEKFRPYDSFVTPLVNGVLQVNSSGLCTVFLARVYNSSSSIDGVVTYVANSAYSN